MPASRKADQSAANPVILPDPTAIFAKSAYAYPQSEDLEDRRNYGTIQNSLGAAIQGMINSSQAARSAYPDWRTVWEEMRRQYMIK